TGLDRFGRVVDQRWIDTGTGAVTDRFQYGYDRAGRRTFRDNLVDPAYGELYTYDPLGQLTSARRGPLNASRTGLVGAPSHSQSWQYDAAGNFGSVTTDGTAQARDHNRQNEITALGGLSTPTFDAAGRMTADGLGRALVYDAWGRLVAYRDG